MRYKKSLTIIDKFLSYVNKTDTCWLWLGTLTKGYGRTRILGKCKMAHVVAYTLFIGEISDKLKVLHKCDVRNCVNPDHLFIGTQKENMEDMYCKGRGPTGEKSGYRKHPEKMVPLKHLCGDKSSNHKLKEVEVIEIKNMLAKGCKSEVIAAKFNVHRITIVDIKMGRSWKQVVI